MQSYSAAKTVTRQFLSGILSLAIGIGIIRFFDTWANLLYDSETKTKELELLVGGIALVASLGWVSKKQFERGLTGYSLVKKSLQIPLIAAILMVVLYVISIIETSDPKMMLVLMLSLLKYMLLGLSIGVIQVIALQITNFNPDEHLLQISNQKDIEACKSGLLPYRHKVSFSWTTLLLCLITLLLATGLWADLRERENLIAILIVCACVGFIFFVIRKDVKAFSNPQIKSIEGSVTKFYKKYGRHKRRELHCEGRIFETDKSIYDKICQEQKYRLWYLPLGIVGQPKVIACEDI